MSKQSESKEKQGYSKQAPCCSNCKSFSSEIERVKTRYSSCLIDHETKVRCLIGGFKVLKNGWCKEHEMK